MRWLPFSFVSRCSTTTLISAILIAASPVLAQVAPYGKTQLTTANFNHKWPALNNLGDVVWSQKDPISGLWQVFKCPSGSDCDSAVPVPVPDNNHNFMYPVIDDAGDIMYLKDNTGLGTGLQVILLQNGIENVVEFSSTNPPGCTPPACSSWRAPGQHFGIARASGTTISYFDFCTPLCGTRSVDISGVGRLPSNYFGADFFDINSQGTFAYSAGGAIFFSTSANPSTQTKLDAGSMPRVGDGSGPQFVYIQGGNTVVVKAAAAPSQIVDTGIWSDINDHNTIAYEQPDISGYSQVWLAKAGNGVDLSQVPASWNKVITEYGPRYAVAEAWSGTVQHDAQDILSGATAVDASLGKGAYALLNFNNPTFPTGTSQIQQALLALGSQVTQIQFLAMDLEPGTYAPDQASIQQRLAFISDAVRFSQRQGERPIIYASSSVWQAVAGSGSTSTTFACLPLWDAHYVTNQTDPVPDLSDFTGYGGWNQRLGVQYNAGCSTTNPNCTGVKLGGSTIDLDVFSQSLFSPTGWGTPGNVSGTVSITRGGFLYNNATKRFSQKVTVTNTSGSTILGPISFILDSLSANASLANLEASVSFAPPFDSPFINIYQSLAPGQSATVTLQFTDPSFMGITYTARAVGCPGAY